MISILMSVYKNDNIEHFKCAIFSVLNQTKLPRQVVLVCDGPLSSEYYQEIDFYKEEFLALGVKFSLVKLDDNVGLGLALKEGVKFCEEKYVLRMDSDDISRANRIAVVEDFIRDQPEVDGFGTHIEEFVDSAGDLGRFRKVPLSAVDIAIYGKKRNPMNHVTMCIKKDALVNVGSYESVLYHEDYFLWVKMIMAGCKLKNLDECLVDVRVGNDLIGRRIGFGYFKLEYLFAKRCFNIGYFSLFDFGRYLLPRSIIRMLPKSILNKIYGQLRV